MFKPRNSSDVAALVLGQENHLQTILCGILYKCPKNPGKPCKYEIINELRKSGLDVIHDEVRNMPFEQKVDLLQKHYMCSYGLDLLVK